MQLHDLKAPFGANKKRKRVGRGESSGAGKTAGRGGKGQTARTGKGKPALGFEGGQMPMYRRMPKRGFKRIPRRPILVVNLDMLANFFAASERVDLAALLTIGVANRRHQVLRVLGRGTVGYPLKVVANHVTPGARQAIEAAGGTVEIVSFPVAIAS